jgi:hypothetical protein
MSDHLGCAQNAAMDHRTAEGRAQGDNGSYIRWPLRRDSTRDDASQTVAYQMDFPAGFGKCVLNRCIQLPSNQEVLGRK